MRRQPNGDPYPTLGPTVASWIEENLVHGEGDALGEPVRLEPFQRFILNQIYKFDPQTGRLLHDRVVIGIPKGNSKTELTAHIGLAELLGPISPLSPNVPVSAASWAQADRLFGAARLAIEGDGGEHAGRLAPQFRVGDHLLDDRILRPDRPGRLYRIAAIAGTNDGGLPTAHLGDELHEWEGERRERVYTVQGKSLRKRRVPRPLPADLRAQTGLDAVFGALQIGITTSGNTLDSLLGRLYLHGLRVASGEVEDPGFLFLWWSMRVRSGVTTEADPAELVGWDLTDRDQLVQAILEANPAAGSFLSIDGIISSYLDPTVPLDEFLRYNGNLFVSSPKAWLTEVQIESRVRRAGQVSPPPPDGTPIVIGFDGSYNRDATALVGWTIADDYGFVIGAWEPENGEPVPRSEVDAALNRAMKRWKVVELAADPPGWNTEIEAWEAEYGTRAHDEANDRVLGSGAVLIFETNQPVRMGPACDHFRAAILNGVLSFDGDPRLVRHLTNAHTRDTRYGYVIVKDSRDSPRKIDLGVAAVIARERAQWHAAHVPRERKPRTVVFS